MTDYVCAFDPKQYRSPQRVWDKALQQYTDEWETTAKFDVVLCDGDTITVPAGYRYNKGSVPRIAWPVIPRDDRAGVIAWQVHDYLYGVKTIPRNIADRIMYELLIAGGMSRFRAQVAYRAVRAAFWKNWG